MFETTSNWTQELYLDMKTFEHNFFSSCDVWYVRTERQNCIFYCSFGSSCFGQGL